MCAVFGGGDESSKSKLCCRLLNPMNILKNNELGFSDFLIL